MISKIINHKYFRLFGVLGLLYFLFTHNGNSNLSNQSFKDGINDFKKHLHNVEHKIYLAKNQNKDSHQDSSGKYNNDTLQKEHSQELLTSKERLIPASNQLNQESGSLSDEDKQSIEFLKTQQNIALNKAKNEIQYIDTPINESSFDKNQIKCGDEVKVLISVISSAGKVLSRNLELRYIYGSNENKIIERMLLNSTLSSIKIAQVPQKIALTNPEFAAFVKKQDTDLNSSMLIIYAEIQELKSLKSC